MTRAPPASSSAACWKVTGCRWTPPRARSTPWNILRQTRPDVIFMDHLMPGMDGFQAIQAIKGNPDTAMIPVVMYTSQEGELYVSQARALGAVGVLPKTVKQADVSRVLYQLRLLPERRDARAAAPAYAAQQDTGAVRGPGAGRRHRRDRSRDPQRDRTAPQGAQHGNAPLRAREPGSFCTAHRHRDETGRHAAACRPSRSKRSRLRRPRAAGRWSRRSPRSHCCRRSCWLSSIRGRWTR